MCSRITEVSKLGCAVTLQVKQYSLFWFETTEGLPRLETSGEQEGVCEGSGKYKTQGHEEERRNWQMETTDINTSIYGIHTVTRKQSLSTQFYFP